MIYLYEHAITQGIAVTNAIVAMYAMRGIELPAGSR